MSIGNPPQKGIPLECIRSGKVSLLRWGSTSAGTENPAESTQRGRGLQQAARPRESVKGLGPQTWGCHPAAHFLSDVNRPSDLSPLICEMGTSAPSQRCPERLNDHWGNDLYKLPQQFLTHGRCWINLCLLIGCILRVLWFGVGKR